MSTQRSTLFAAGIAALLAFLSLIGVNAPPPSEWLVAWTTWVAAAVGIVVSARVLWAGGTRLLR
jgi:hypothetical protein